MDWKNDGARMARFVNVVEQQFTEGDEPGGFIPKTPTRVLGFPVTQLFPQSVGMGAGFSVVVDAPFAKVLQSVEKQVGKPLKCSTSEGATACEQSLGAQRNLVLMASTNPAAKNVLMGCFYYYEK